MYLQMKGKCAMWPNIKELAVRAVMPGISGSAVNRLLREREVTCKSVHFI